MVAPKGNLYTIIAFDPDGKPVALRMNASGELMTVVSGGGGSGTPAVAKGRLITPVVFDPDGKPVGLSTDEYGQLAIAVSGYTAPYTEGARVYNSANISVPNENQTALTFDSERYDTDTIHDLVTNTGYLTCVTAGKYIISGSLRYATNSNGQRQTSIRLNGTTYIAANKSDACSSGRTSVSVNTIYILAVDDYVELMALQNRGGALNVEVVGNFSPEFSIQRIG